MTMLMHHGVTTLPNPKVCQYLYHALSIASQHQPRKLAEVYMHGTIHNVCTIKENIESDVNNYDSKSLRLNRSFFSECVEQPSAIHITDNTEH